MGPNSDQGAIVRLLDGKGCGFAYDTEGWVHDVRFYGADADIALVSRMPGASRISRVTCAGPQITDDGFSRLAALKGLRSLYLDRGCPVSGAALRHLIGLQIEDFAAHLQVGLQVGLRHIAEFSCLERLEIYDAPAVEAGWLLVLGCLNRLQKLNLGNSCLAEQCIGDLAGLPRLREVGIARTGVRGTLGELARLAELETLDLSGNPLTDNDLAPLSRLARLQELTLDGTAITGSGIAHLARCSRLRHLSLNRTGVDDDLIDPLRRLANSLLRLELDDTCVTRRGLWAIREALPDCEIEAWHLEQIED